ncbi:hypothetical protein NC651_023866 [Populus alba x Populus x berolinensis]|nr:hypothetical protein NC651_023866 [Populus alba x Populus x berolinensis]
MGVRNGRGKRVKGTVRNRDNNQQETSTGSQPLKVNRKRLEASHRSLLLLEQPIQYSHENNHPSLPISSISIVNEN